MFSASHTALIVAGRGIQSATVVATVLSAESLKFFFTKHPKLIN
jgi:hypothetical protein